MLLSQTTLNTGYAGDITALYTYKQNTLTSGNLLNSAFIYSTKMQYLSSIGGVVEI